MKTSLSVLLISVLVLAQGPGARAQNGKHPRVGFTDIKGAAPFVDTDVFDEQKYIEGIGGDTTTVKAKRASHEAALMREFMDGFNQTKECDGIVMMGMGDNEPDFALEIMIDSHDTPGQKAVWNWVLRDVNKNRVLPAGLYDDSAKDAAKDICAAVWKNSQPESAKKP